MLDCLPNANAESPLLTAFRIVPLLLPILLILPLLSRRLRNVVP